MFSQNEKIVYFVQAIMDMYKDEEDRDTYGLPPIPNKDGEMTEDLYCMFIALKVIYQKITDTKCDNIDFITVLTRLVFQFSKHLPASDDDSEVDDIEDDFCDGEDT